MSNRELALGKKRGQKGMRVNPFNYLKRNWVLTLIVAMFFVWTTFTLIRQEVKLAELKKERQDYQIQMDELKKEISDLEKEIMKSQSSEFIEQMAKEKLKMVKSDEIIYYIKGSNRTK